MESLGTNEYDIAIVGGGISGIYTAWRLLKEADKSGKLTRWKQTKGTLRVAIFEGSDRIGGRILSAQPPGLPHMICEIGGMRYVSSQKLVAGLVEKKLKLKRHEQAVDEPINIAYLRGKKLRNYQLSDPEVLPYNLSDKEKEWIKEGNPASNLIGWAVEELLPEIKKQNLSGPALEKYLREATLDEIPLYHYGFWNLLAKVMSHEALEIARATVGYDVLGMNYNAVDCIAEYFDFTPEVKYYLLDGGYETLPWTLQDQFKEAGGEIHLNQWLQSFDKAILADGSEGVELRFSENGTGYKSMVKAKAIVLAMPKRSLELLSQTGPVMSPERAPHVRFLMNAVTPIDLYKMFLVYYRPWWDQAYVSKGRSLTDLPVRQCYYWGVEGEQPGGTPNDTHALIMAYNDLSSSEFWEGLRDQALGPEESIHWVLPGGLTPDDIRPKSPTFPQKQRSTAADTETPDERTSQLRKNWDAHPAPKKMVAEMHRQLMEMHGVQQAPEPVGAAFVDWSDDPYGGAVHFWNSGYKSWEVLELITQPVKDFPCYLCGEAYSTNQTWVEGALQTAEIVLTKHFGLPTPTWLSHE